MGWFWGASDSGKSSSSGEDPLRSLDPSLREFLAKESPVKYSSTNPPAPKQETPAPSPQPTQTHSTTSTQENNAQENSGIPEKTLFKDGRYAHLWSTYQSHLEIESASKTDAEKINEVLEGYKYRKAEIGRAALENCALEQWDVNECFQSGGLAARMTMCRAENRSLERCYLMQAKFLKALGYLSAFDRPAEVDERIQMHADTLYHRMLDQEKAIEAAKAEGKPIPTFPPLLSKSKPSVSAQSHDTETTPQPIEPGKIKPANLPVATQKTLKKRLEGLTGEEREIEERAIAAELKAAEQLAGQLGGIYQKQDEDRRQRKEQGRETIGDKLVSIFSWR